MATETAPTVGRTGNWKAGVVGGLAGGLVFGAMMTAMTPDVIEVAIPSLYGFAPPPDGLAGWVLHMSHAAVIGVGFAAAIGAAGLAGASGQRQVAAGLVYGVVVWLVFAAILMPVWLDGVGSPADPPLPNLNTTSLIGHAVYGIVLGAVYYALEGI